MTWLAIRAFLGRVPRTAWLAIAAALALWLVWTLHKREVRAADRAGFSRGVTLTQAAYRRNLEGARVIAMQRRARQEAAAAAITRTLNDETARLRDRVRLDADRLRQQGPGAAAYRGQCDYPSVPGGTSSASAPGPVAPGSGMPAEDRAVVPWSFIVRSAEQHDALRQEISGWRRWHEQQSAAWEKFRSGKP